MRSRQRREPLVDLLQHVNYDPQEWVDILKRVIDDVDKSPIDKLDDVEYYIQQARHEEYLEDRLIGLYDSQGLFLSTEMRDDYIQRRHNEPPE